MDEARRKSTGGEHEQTMEIFDSFWHDRRRWYSVNLPNGGAVTNLPKDSVLEIPAMATAEGWVVPPYGELSVGLAAITMRRISAIEASVEAALTGNRKMFVEALILDGTVSDYATATKLAEAMLKAQAKHLPQFS